MDAVTLPEIRHLFVHEDFDGVASGAMIAAAAGGDVRAETVNYDARDGWLARRLPPASAVLDFHWHPDAVLWVDHHTTTFLDPERAAPTEVDALHVWDDDAPSCPHVIVRQPWFPRALARRFETLVQWSDRIDAARFRSPEEATDLDEPHVLFALVVPMLRGRVETTDVVSALASGRVADALALPAVASVASEVRAARAEVHARVAAELEVDGAVLLSDQSGTGATYERYLPFRLHPEARWLVGIYEVSDGFTVSVGANPWARPQEPHLGRLCATLGGGGRRHAAGITRTTLESARQAADAVVAALAGTTSAGLATARA